MLLKTRERLSCRKNEVTRTREVTIELRGWHSLPSWLSWLLSWLFPRG